MLTPSFLAHVLNGLVLFTLLIIILNNYLSGTLFNKQTTELISLILLFSIAIGVHGISHLFQEVYYGWNPLNP